MRSRQVTRKLRITLVLATMLVVAACGGSDTGRSDRADPVEPRRAQAESDRQSAPEETAREEAPRKSSGLTVTTLEGERVNPRGQGDVTALYFMAGW